MHILISNDDGIRAPGLAALHGALLGLGKVTVVAPDAERSAMGHAITLSDPLRARRVQCEGGFSGYAVEGTPADSVKLAVCALLAEPVEMIVSGINLGPNAGISVIYSGTVSAATEGTILGIPSMAISLDAFTNPCWTTAARVARVLVRRLSERPLPRGVLLNVNVPNRPWECLEGFAVTRMAESRFVETFDRRADPRGDVYYWMDGYLQATGDVEETDLEALKKGFVSLTPIHFDLTHELSRQQLRGWDLSDA
jgi:5'-nucleotidase